MASIHLVAITPSQLIGNDHQDGYDVGRMERRFLAQGDSWFSLGHVPPWSTTNLLQQFVLSRASVAVNCAHPGEVLAHMVDTSTQQDFLRLLNGRQAWRWHAVLVSGGGNDLIDALNADPGSDRDSTQRTRLLLRADEWATDTTAVLRYINEPGWATFARHLEVVLLRLLAQRDRKAVNRDVPLVLHTYDYLTPRNAPAGPALGPWLYKALHTTYRIPAADWIRLADVFIDRLADLWTTLAARHAGRNIRVVDTRGATTRAGAGSTGPTRHWENEIHPTALGYAELAKVWRPILDAL